MQEICYYVADDGKKFDDRWDCIEYERRKVLETHKDEFQFFDYRKQPIPIEEATTENVTYIIVKSDKCVEAIGNWFDNDGCRDPFEGVYCECVGTWVYGDAIDRGDEWLKLELEIEKLQTLIAEVNQ
jgi:hypothetical protein